MPVTPYSAGASRRVHPAPTTPAAKPRRLFSATQTPPSQKTPQRLLVASSPYNTPVRYSSPSASNCACWHGKQPPPWRVAWQPPSPYLEDLTKTLVIAPPVRRRLQLVPAVRLKTASVSPYEPPRDASARASRFIRAQLQVEPAEHHPPYQPPSISPPPPTPRPPPSLPRPSPPIPSHSPPPCRSSWPSATIACCGRGRRTPMRPSWGWISTRTTCCSRSNPSPSRNPVPSLSPIPGPNPMPGTTCCYRCSTAISRRRTTRRARCRLCL
jgi:hypothetical protein